MIGILTVVGLFALGALLFIIGFINYHNPTVRQVFEVLGAVASIVGGVAAVLVFLVPAATVPEPTQPGPQTGSVAQQDPMEPAPPTETAGQPVFSSDLPTWTPVPPTWTPVPPTWTPVPPTWTPVPEVFIYNVVSTKNAASLNDIEKPREELGLSPGVHKLRDVPYEIGWPAATQYNFKDGWPTQLEFSARIPRPRRVFILFNGSGMRRHTLDQTVGGIRLIFEDGRDIRVSLVGGANLRDWATNRYPDSVGSTFAENVSEELNGIVPMDGQGVRAVIDRMVITIPSEYHNTTLSHIVVTDTSAESVSHLDPSIYILAITVESVQ